MNRYIAKLIILCWLVLLTGCANYKPAVDTRHAEVFGPYPIVSVNGETLLDTYSINLPEGQHQFEVLFETYGSDYRCLFNTALTAGKRYEVVKHGRGPPLVLYLYASNHWLWGQRLNRVEAIGCNRYPRAQKQADKN